MINDELLQHAIEQCDGCMDETQVEPEDAAAWKVVRAALTQRAELVEAAKEFIRKCDAGEARSKRSYAAFKAALNKLGEST